jgi:glutamine amidotransferase
VCRLLALRAKEPIPICRSLIGGDNSFAVQSLEHPDGWGLAYYVDRIPHVVKSILPAISDQQFERISLAVESSTLLAHIRRATTGAISARNCHPFQFGPWVFAHNGFIRNFPAIKNDLRGKISPRLRRLIIGETDSETFFYLFLTHLSAQADIFDPQVPEAALARALATSIEEVRAVADVGPEIAPHSADQSWLSVLMTNGVIMLGARVGRSFACQRTQTQRGQDLLLFSSEVIGGLSAQDGWIDLKEEHYVYVTPELEVRHGAL